MTRGTVRHSAWSGRLGRILVALSLLVTGIAVGIGAPRPTPSEASPSTPELLLVGDSMMHSLAQPYGASARALLGARHTFLLDTAGCRRLITTSCRIGSGPTPANAWTVVQARAGQYHRALVVAVGYNDPTYGAGSLAVAVDVLRAEARSQGIEHIIWLTYREAGPSASRFRAHNDLLRAKAATDPNLIIADWALVSSFMPTSWFSSDGIHLGADAARGLADVIADAADLLDLLPPETACSIADARTTAAPSPAGGSGLGTLGGSAGVTDRAGRLHLACP
jgi:hypothetical protein